MERFSAISSRGIYGTNPRCAPFCYYVQNHRSLQSNFTFALRVAPISAFKYAQYSVFKHLLLKWTRILRHKQLSYMSLPRGGRPPLLALRTLPQGMFICKIVNHAYFITF